MGILKRTLSLGRTAPPTTPTATPVAVETVQRAVTIPAVEIVQDDALYAYCLTSPGVVEIDTLKMDSAALRAMHEAGIRLILPLVSQGELVGLLQLGARLSEQDYSSDDVRLLNNLSSQAATALRVAQLAYQQQVEARRRERIEQELAVAGIIQQTLLPKGVPSLTGWGFAAHWQPARTVGGDFYDFIPLSDSRLMITIGDVTDKGVPAALVMASTRSVIRAAAERLISPGEVLKRTNDVLHPDVPAKMFVTCLCAVLDINTGRLEYANAGHNPPQQRTSQGVVELRARGMPLGLMPNMEYEVKETQLAPGDTVLFYSDGLVEAHNEAHDMFGMKRLQALVTEHPGGESLIGFLKDALFTFTGAQWEQEDDVTYVVFQRELKAGRRPAHTEHGDGEHYLLDEFEIVSAPGNEREAMERTATAISALNLPPARMERIKTAVAETTMNAMEHGNKYQPDKPVQIGISANDHELIVSVTDQGGDQPILDAPAPDLDAKLAGLQSARGWGLFLVKAMVDDMRIRAEDGAHTVELVINLEGDSHAHQKI